MLDYTDLEPPRFLLVVVGAVAYIIFLYSVAERIGWPVAIRGFYPLFGVALTYFIYSDINMENRKYRITHYFSLIQLEKISITTSMLYLSVVLLLDVRWKLLLVVLPILIYASIRSIVEGERNRSLRLLIVTFFLPPATKIIANGYYFGNGDILKDIPEAIALVQEGNISALPAWYPRFPFTYILTAATSMVSGGQMYFVYHVVGILGFSLLPLFTYVTLRNYTNHATAIAGGFTTIVLYPLLRWATYFIPVAHALLLFATLVYLSSNSSRFDWRWSGFIFVVILSTLLTHHLSVLIMLSILILAFLVKRFITPGVLMSDKLFLVVKFVAIGAVSYWIYNGVWFIREVMSAGLGVLYIILSGFSETGIKYISEGISIAGVEVFRPPPPRVLADGVIWLATPDGILNALYICLFILAFVSMKNHRNGNRNHLIYAIPGLLGTLALLKTPLVFPGLFRVRLFWSFIAVFYLVFGVRYLITGVERNGVISKSMVVLLVLAMAAPLSAADDVKELRPDADMQIEKEFSGRELAEINSAATFTKSYTDSNLATLHLSRLYINAWYPDLHVITRPEFQKNNCKGSYFLYRISWARYSVITKSDVETGPGAARQVVTSKDRISAMVSNSEKVYTSGNVGLVRTSC